MEERGYIGKLYSMCEWVYRIAYLNILWIFFTFAGLFVFGLVPSTVAMFSITRKWVMGNKDIKIFKTFWESYRKEFLKVQVLGFVLILVGLILIVDYKFYISQHVSTFFLLKFLWLGIVLLYSIIILFLFPIYAHYQFKPYQYIKNAFVIAISFPLQSFLMIGGSIFMVLFAMKFPGVSLFLSGSAFSYWITFIAHQVFSKMELKIENVNSNLIKQEMI